MQASDRIKAMRGINLCVDLFATPYYIRGSGYEEGLPVPWIVSDFGLVGELTEIRRTLTTHEENH